MIRICVVIHSAVSKAKTLCKRTLFLCHYIPIAGLNSFCEAGLFGKIRSWSCCFWRLQHLSLGLFLAAIHWILMSCFVVSSSEMLALDDQWQLIYWQKVSDPVEPSFHFPKAIEINLLSMLAVASGLAVRNVIARSPDRSTDENITWC